jgi:hypothetical protein
MIRPTSGFLVSHVTATEGLTSPPRCNMVLRRASRAHRRSSASSQNAYTPPHTRTGPRSSTRATRTGADALLLSFYHIFQISCSRAPHWYTSHADPHVLGELVLMAADQNWFGADGIALLGYCSTLGTRSLSRSGHTPQRSPVRVRSTFVGKLSRWTVKECVPIHSGRSLQGGTLNGTARGAYVCGTFRWAHDETRTRPRVMYTVPVGQNPSGLVCGICNFRNLFYDFTASDVARRRDSSARKPSMTFALNMVRSLPSACCLLIF